LYTSNSSKTIRTAIEVSVIIPCYNDSRHLLETLHSVASQDLASFECLIIDDGSDDGSWDIALDFSQSQMHFQVYRRPDSLPKGANSCRNFGAEMALGRYLVFLDADDLLEKGALTYRLTQLPPEVNLAIFKTANFSSDLHQASPFSDLVKNGLKAQDYLDLFLDYSIPWHTSSGLWEKSFFLKINGFDPGLQRFQDVDIHIRALVNSSLRLWVDTSSRFTSFYRKSEYHQEVTLSKRKFLLNQGFVFLSKLRENFGASILPKTSGLAIYLAFRFEEVMGKSELEKLSEYFDGHLSNCSKSLKSILLLQRTLPQPSKLRKGLSYFIYRFYRFNKDRL
jgi:glycosyltransferase involved in cell wall biosynthesis